MAFKFDERFLEINRLSAETQTALWTLDSMWHKTVGTASDSQRIDASHTLLDAQDKHIIETQKRAVEQGLNVTAEIRQLYDDQPPALA